jgi:hypothetical protein
LAPLIILEQGLEYKRDPGKFPVITFDKDFTKSSGPYPKNLDKIINDCPIAVGVGDVVECPQAS